MHLANLSVDEQYRVASADSGFIGQNVYLYCASEGLGTVFRTSFDHSPLARALQLGNTQFITFVQTVGYPGASASPSRVSTAQDPAAVASCIGMKK